MNDDWRSEWSTSTNWLIDLNCLIRQVRPWHSHIKFFHNSPLNKTSLKFDAFRLYEKLWDLAILQILMRIVASNFIWILYWSWVGGNILWILPARSLLQSFKSKNNGKGMEIKLKAAEVEVPQIQRQGASCTLKEAPWRDELRIKRRGSDCKFSGCFWVTYSFLVCFA